MAARSLPGTLVTDTSWSTSTGWIVAHDAMLIGPWHHGYSSAVTRPGKVGLSLRLTTDLRLGFEGGSARARTTMREGDIEKES